MADEKKQNIAVKALAGIGNSIKEYKAKVAEEQTLMQQLKVSDPEHFKKNAHFLGKEMPPTKVKMLESVIAAVVGYTGARTTFYALNALTDQVPEKGQPAGFFRNVSGAIRTVLGLATLGIAGAFAAHAWSINPPDKLPSGRGAA